MNEIDLLLSDEFVEFSAKIKEIHEKKKSKQSEFKALYDKFKAEVQSLDDEAKGLKSDFEVWKTSQMNGATKVAGDTPKTPVVETASTKSQK